MASTGQTFMHALQLMQKSESIIACSSAIVMHETGHSSMHTPHFVHFLVTSNDISLPPLTFDNIL